MQMTCREFNQQISKAQRAAQIAPVFITNRGKPAFVLISQAEYDRLFNQPKTIAAALAAPDNFDLSCERVDIELRAVEF